MTDQIETQPASVVEQAAWAPAIACDTERQIIRAIVEDALRAGCTVSVDNGGDEYELTRSSDLHAIGAAIGHTSVETLVCHRGEGRGAWVMLIYGNGDGTEVISDHSATDEMEQLLVRAWALAAELAEQVA